MPEVTSCPQCQRKLRVPDELLGKKVKCPGCGLTFTAAADAPAPPVSPSAMGTEPSRRAVPAPPLRRARRDEEEDVEDDPPEEDFEERKPKVKGSRAAWTSVRLGITLVLVAILGMVITIAIQFIAQVALASSMPRRFDPNNPTADVSNFFLLGICIQILSVICRSTQVAGYWFFMRVPERSGAGSLAGICFGTGIANIVLGMIMSVLMWTIIGSIPNMMPNAANPFGQFTQSVAMAWVFIILAVIIFLLYLTEYFCSLFFHKMVADHLKSRAVSASIIYQVVVSVISMLMTIGLVIVSFAIVGAAAQGSGAFRQNGDMLAALLTACSCANIILYIGLCIWYIVTHFLMLSVVSGPINRR